MHKVIAAIALFGSAMMIPGYVSAEDVVPADFERGNHQGWVQG
jgi:hypothetical protein